MNRRGFLGLLAGATAAEIIRPKTYIFAPRGGWNNRLDVSSPRSSSVSTRNATMFHDGEKVEFYFHRGVRNMATATICHVDPATNTIWFSDPLTDNLQPGDIIIAPRKFDGLGFMDIIEGHLIA